VIRQTKELHELAVTGGATPVRPFQNAVVSIAFSALMAAGATGEDFVAPLQAVGNV
jgi:hypothetical protein